MQLVNENVSILNPTKDNLILDSAGVEQILGVPPQRVIDVMALRGDSIDNIPGAPGIGDKGSVELIQQFGTVEAAMDAAVSNARRHQAQDLPRVARQQPRQHPALQRARHHPHRVPIKPTRRHAHATRRRGCRTRSLHRTRIHHAAQRTRSRRLDTAPTTYTLNATADDLAQLLAEARKENPTSRIALAATAQAIAEEVAAEPADPNANPTSKPSPNPPAQTMSLFGAPADSSKRTGFARPIVLRAIKGL